jgi:hypothetical protein
VATPRQTADAAGSDEVGALLAQVGDWRGPALSRFRSLIRQACPEVVEELKWRKPSNPSGVPVWSLDGMICTGEVDKDHVKLTFAHGAALEDPSGLFNASLDGHVRRAIDVAEDAEVDEAAFVALVRAAAARNASLRRGR